MIFLDVLGYILARDIIAKEPYPPFAASVKDGYAVVGNTVFEITDQFIFGHFFRYRFIYCDFFAASDGVGKRQVLGPVTAGDMVMFTGY